MLFTVLPTSAYQGQRNLCDANKDIEKIPRDRPEENNTSQMIDHVLKETSQAGINKA